MIVRIFAKTKVNLKLNPEEVIKNKIVGYITGHANSTNSDCASIEPQYFNDIEINPGG